jgi:type II secretory pathway pseudopilin PulG
MKTLTILIPMHLAGQDEIDRHHRQAGYAMAALIVGLAVLAVLMTVAMPVWKQTVQREKEEELVFRGEQYARAVGLFQHKFANAYPPTIDVLVEQKFLRKKYKDPITDDDFVPLTQSQTTPQGGAQTAPGRGGQPQGPGAQAAPGRGGTGVATPGAVTQGGAPAGGIVGVTSKSKDLSIRLYKGRSHYNEWAFVYTAPPAAGGTAPGGPNSGGRGTGQRGTPPGNNPPIPGTGPGPGGLPGRGGRGTPPPGGPNLPGGRGSPFSPFNSGQPPFPTAPPGRGR